MPIIRSPGAATSSRHVCFNAWDATNTRPRDGAAHVKKHRDRQKSRQQRGEENEETVGKVIRIVERKTNTFIGLFVKRGKFSFVQPEDALLPPSVNVVNPPSDVRSGQVVVVKLLDWENVVV